MKEFFRISVFLLALNFLTENFGYLSHPLYQFLGMFFLVLYGLMLFPLGLQTEKRGIFLSGCLLLIISIFFFRGDILSRVVGTGLFLFSLILLLKSKGSEEKEIPLLLLTVTFYFYFLLFYLYSPPVWYGLKRTSLYFSNLVSKLSGIPILFSSTFLGLPITFLFLIFILISFLYSGKKKKILFILSLVSLPILSGCYLVLMGVLPTVGNGLLNLFKDENNFLRLILNFFFQKDYPLPKFNYTMNALFLLFVLYMIPLFLILRGRTIENSAPELKISSAKNTLAFFILIVLGASLLMFDLPGKTSEKKQVVLYNKGYLNWEVPNFRMFGSRSAGMFGNLPLFLEAMGFSTKKVDTLSQQELQEAKILVMINTDSELPREELEAIWKFIEDGGSLLLLGDHTFWKHEVKRIILNDVLQPFNIRFNFDSADWFVGGWINSYQYTIHPIAAGMKDDLNEAGIVIGASLTVEPPAFPIVIGKYGYSDPGNEEAGGQRGYLGNLDYDPGEPMGDVVLCGAQHYGKGKVLVFGDTSSFANAIMVNNHDFVNRVFTWLAKDESPKRYRLSLFLALILFAGALFFYIRTSQNSYYLVISLVVSLGVFWAAESIKQVNNQIELRGDIAYVDASHGERFSPEGWNEDGIMGLFLNLMRNGYLSFSLQTFDKNRLDQSDLLILISPSSPFSKKEINWIRDFVYRGGKLILTVGWEERVASVPLMESFGLSLDYLPLAQFMSLIPYANQRVRFFEAWPVVNQVGEAQVIAGYQKLPVAVKKRYGKGQVVMIGDSAFFCNKNLEMEQSYIQGNIQFLQWLLTTLKQKPEVVQ